jgi:hypothetical protein
MNRIWTSVWTASLLTVGAVLPAAASRDQVQPRLIPVPVGRTPSVQVWTDAGDGAVLFPGEKVDVAFRTNRDAFVVVVDIDTRGRARLLFPESRYDDGFVRGKRTVHIPTRRAGYRLQVTGPAGTERIVAFASDEPLVDFWRELAEGELFAEDDLRGRDWDDVAWRGSISIRTGNADIVLAGGSRGDVQPQLVRVPVEDCALTRDETWFRVGRPHKGRRW